MSHSGSSTSVYTRESEYTYHSDQSLQRVPATVATGTATSKRAGRGGFCQNAKTQIHDFVCSFHGLLTVCGLILCIKYAPAFYHWVHPHYWEAPKTWDTCQNLIGQPWQYMGSPCVTQDDALCTYSVNNALFSWCSGRYYSTPVSSAGKWTSFANDGVLSAIWTAGDSCDELGFKGWGDICQQQNSAVECKLNQLRGFLYCTDNGEVYTYNLQDGSYARYNSD
jgi:hypothetical protein